MPRTTWNRTRLSTSELSEKQSWSFLVVPRYLLTLSKLASNALLQEIDVHNTVLVAADPRCTRSVERPVVAADGSLSD